MSLNTTKLDAAVRALTHAQTQIDQARVVHAKIASDLEELSGVASLTTQASTRSSANYLKKTWTT